MLYTSEDLFEKFKQEHQGEYPHLSSAELHSACTSQFEQIKGVIESGKLEDVRLQYLFTIKVMKFRVIRHIKSTFLNYSLGHIKRENFTKYAIILLDYVQRNPTKFEKYYEIIREVTGFTKEEISQGEYKHNPGKKFNTES